MFDELLEQGVGKELAPRHLSQRHVSFSRLDILCRAEDIGRYRAFRLVLVVNTAACEQDTCGEEKNNLLSHVIIPFIISSFLFASTTHEWPCCLSAHGNHHGSKGHHK